jgi:serine phosphatase RsbU (regulator of sigma subunit)/class 3 adenylate cyclase
MKCASCQSDLNERARICKTCGHPVTHNPVLEDLYFSRLTANAPSAFVNKVRSAPYLAKEQRTVTGIMLTIANSENFDKEIPEEERTPILNHALDQFAEIIFQYEGTIAKLWENTVLAFFGAPISHEDDPLRAIHAASQILLEVKRISSETTNSHGIPFRVKLVINSGAIVIGDIKSNLKFDFKSLSYTLECMDVALWSSIQPCEIILLEDAYRFTKPFVKCEPLDEIYCDMTNADMRLWRVEQILKTSENHKHPSLNTNMRLVGREKEMELLLELSETVLAGLGRVGLIIGEPGIGKSRLIKEWKLEMRSVYQPTRIRWIQAHGLAFGRELAYHLLKNLLRNALEIPENAGSHQIKQTLKSVLQELLDVDQDRMFEYLAHLLDVTLSQEQEAHIHNLNATELRAQYLAAIRSLFINLAHEQPLVIILEDLHWADASSIDLLVELLSLTVSCPILLCLITRPDRESNGWHMVTLAREQFGPRLTEITLGSLDPVQSQTLVKQAMGIDDLPDIIARTVLRKSEGNPYFIEELIRMLINEDVMIKHNGSWALSPGADLDKVPGSLQGLLTARIDRLLPEARLSLRIASVIGRTFPEKLIENVMAKEAPEIHLLEQLGQLESIGMVRVAQVHPELTYTFVHILLHDAVYNSIYAEDRKALHHTVGSALEELYPDQQERLASQLAHHFLQSGDSTKALTYLDLAGHVARDSFANAEAENYFTQAVQLAKDPKQAAHIYTDLGEVEAQQGKHREAVQAWKNAIHHYQILEYSDRLARVYAWSARSAWWGYDPRRSLEICLEGLKAVEGVEESPDIAYLIHETGRAYLFNDQPEKAQAYSEQALEMAKRLNAFNVQAEALATIGILPTTKPKQAIAALEMAVKLSESHNLYGPASRAYINLAAVIDNLGEVRLARDYQKRAIELGNKAGGVSDQIIIQQSIARASLWLADFDDAKSLIEKMRQDSRQKDAYLDENTLNLLFLEGSLSRFQGDFQMAMETYTDLIDRSRQIHDLERSLQGNRALIEVIIESHLLGDPNADRANLDITLSMLGDAIQTGRENNLGQDVATQTLLSNINALTKNFAKAEKALEAANSRYRSQPVMQDRLKIILAQARLEAARNNFPKAIELFHESAELLEKMEGRWWQARVWMELANLYLKRNEPEDIDQAQNLFRESLAVFNELGVGYYPDLTIEKLRQVKHVSRAQAIAHKQITQELEEAGRVQNTFLPTRAPIIPGYDISGVLLPARETSGDFFDFIELDQGKLGLVIADVGDKGAGAALYMAMSRTLIRTYAGENKLPPDQVIHHVNRRIFSDTQRGIFLTLVFGILDPEAHTFTYVNAGHNPPYLISPNHQDAMELTELEKTGTLVGIFPENSWETKTINMKPGEVLVLYTDGITEAQNKNNEFYGNDRFLQNLKNQFNPSAEVFRNAVLENVQAFSGTAPRLDDITLVLCRRALDKNKTDS